MLTSSSKFEKIYPKSSHGKFRSIRRIVSTIILGAYFIIPFLSIGGRPALLLDIPSRKFYLFGLVIWPQEVYYVVFFLIFLAIAFFFVTAIAGRVWCGYGCPQTLFTDLFIAIERFVDGDRNAMIKLSKEPLSPAKVAKGVLKHSLWLIVSLVVGITFLSYFIPIGELFLRFSLDTLTSANISWIISVALFTYIDCAFLRGWMCSIPCPYGRFQGALFDGDTLIIAYDGERGEPRSANYSKQEGATFGDCIDCTLCVQVCPAGIDIRDGLQYECTACADCIDACNTIMAKVGRAPNLIKYSSLNSLKGNSLKGGKAHIFRPRVIAYSLILIILATVLVYSLVTRSPLALDVLRERSALYYEGADGEISNLYKIKALNKDTVERSYLLSVEGIKGAELILSENPFKISSGEVYEVSVVVNAPASSESYGVKKFNFIITDTKDTELHALQESTFFYPERAR